MKASGPDFQALSPSGDSHAVLLVLAGPAGSGKTTLCERMVREVPGFSRVITATTRLPRPGEVDGVHYHFLTPETFDARVAAGEFLEWAVVHRNKYGTPASSVLQPLAEGRNLIINVDVQGVENFRRAAAANPLLRRHLATVFIRVEIDELRRRMVERGTDAHDEISRRMQTAEWELLEAGKFDHRIESRGRDDDFAALIAIYQSVRSRLQAAARPAAVRSGP